LNEYSNDKLIKNISNYQIFLDHEVLKDLNLDFGDVQEVIVNEIINYTNVFEAYTSNNMMSQNYTHGINEKLQNGFNHKRSGDVLFVLSPSVISYHNTGSTHGSGFNYDTHVPLL